MGYLKRATTSGRSSAHGSGGGVWYCQHRVLRTSHAFPVAAARLAAVPRDCRTLRACGLQLRERGYPLVVVQAHMQGGWACMLMSNRLTSNRWWRVWLGGLAWLFANGQLH